MARLRQLAGIYLRGALANQTMRNLTPSQQGEVKRWMDHFCNLPALAGHKHEFISKLGQTIGGDYRDDRANAEAEFIITIWRGVVYLLYHYDYSYRCLACRATKYKTQRGELKAFDRCYPECPACTKVKLNGSKRFITAEQLQRLTSRAALYGKKPPSWSSPIVPARGTKKIADPAAILADDTQATRFFGEWIWNYFRQILKENEIKHHNALPKDVTGPADLLAVAELICLCEKFKVDYSYCQQDNPDNGHYRLFCNHCLTPPEFSVALANLKTRYQAYEVELVIEPAGVAVADCHGLAPIIKVALARSEPVMMLTSPRRIGDETESAFIVENIQDPKWAAGGSSMPEHNLETSEFLKTVRNALPDDAQQVFDLISGTGETYQQYQLPTAAGVLGKGQIASILGFRPKQIARCWKDIKIQLLAHGLTR